MAGFVRSNINTDPDAPEPVPRQSDIKRRPDYVWESAPFLWQTPQTEGESSSSDEARELLTEIRRREMERLGVHLSPWERARVGKN